ncbi:MAG: TIGR03790 family protein [Planctomycetota bacterium]|jgi:uncharacterized protein (TIGR03790 family)
MKFWKVITIFLLFFSAWPSYGLEPEEILVIANRDIAVSMEIARYYCAKRKVPVDNIVSLPLGSSLNDTISRADYEKKLVGPIQKKLAEPELAGRIRCLLTIYGVPIKVGRRGPLKEQQKKLQPLRKLLENEKNKLEHLKQQGSANSSEQEQRINRNITRLQSAIDLITGKETNASVDSELSMLQFGNYELYRWRPNGLKNEGLYWDFFTLMVCRLDGPSPQIVKGLIDKAISAEKMGLSGIAYIDSRGLANDNKRYSFGWFDQSLRDLAELLRSRSKMDVKEEQTAKLFEDGTCPRTAIYCGWYSLKKYVDAFDFVDGAIGYHISSLEAVDLRDGDSDQWCPAMLTDGVTATFGAVAEPYLHSFPEPKAFFREFLNGLCLVESYYRTKPFNSWQLVLIGDPLYKPFGKS